MKTILTTILTVLSYVSSIVFGIWCVVDFFIYLVKDNPFDFWILWVAIGSFVSIYLFAILAVIFNAKDEKKKRRIFNRVDQVKESKFQERLRKAAEERGYKAPSK